MLAAWYNPASTVGFDSPLVTVIGAEFPVVGSTSELFASVPATTSFGEIEFPVGATIVTE